MEIAQYDTYIDKKEITCLAKNMYFETVMRELLEF